MKNARIALAVLLLFATFAIAQQPAPVVPAPAANPNDPAEMLKQGRALVNQGKHDEALALYEKVMQRDPKNPDVHMAVGVVLDLKGEYAKAREHFQHAIDLAPDDAKKASALRNMAFSYAYENKGAEEIKYEQPIFDTRTKANDYVGAAEIANELARLLLESGDINGAETWYRKGYESAMKKTDLAPKDKALWEFRWHNAQARIAARRGKKDEAQKHVAEAKTALDAAENPQQAPFWPYLTGYVAFYGKDYPKAIEELQKGDQRDPFVLALLAQAYEKAGQKDKAKDLYAKIMTFNNHNPTGVFARAIAKKKMGK